MSASPEAPASTRLGYLQLVLHAHLPFVRHPEYDDFLEEDWLFEAITETYVPVLHVLQRLKQENVRYRLAMSVSPTLAAMLADPLLNERYRRYLDKLTSLAESEVRGNPEWTRLGHIARHYEHRFGQVRGFLVQWGWDLLAAIRDLQDSHHLEVLACNATHGFLPLMSGPAPRRAQIRAGIQAYRRTFGRKPHGMWLAECGWDHGLDKLLAEEGIGHVFVDTHALTFGRPAAPAGPYGPVRTPAGVVVFGRDQETSRQVWSTHEGYPADPVYREFYRDLGFDAGYAYIRPYLHRDGIRRSIGYKCHRVTGPVPLGEKDLYDPLLAEWRAREHGRNFVFNRLSQLKKLEGTQEKPPVVVSMYDAELFGHWWYEGPIFLEEVLRASAEEAGIETITGSDLLAGAGSLPVVRPNPSTWGENGNNQMWLNGENAWMYRYQHWAEREMTNLVRQFGKRGGGLVRRAVAQAGRELLLLQSSDWAFIMTTGTTPPYAVRRFKDHLETFRALRDSLYAGNPSEAFVSACEGRTPLFDNLDVAAWS